MGVCAQIHPSWLLETRNSTTFMKDQALYYIHDGNSHLSYIKMQRVDSTRFIEAPSWGDRGTHTGNMQ